MLELYNNDSFHAFLRTHERSWINYAEVVIDAVSPYLARFFVEESETVIIFGNSNPISSVKSLFGGRFDDLLNSAVESGDNAAEFSLLAIDHYRELLDDPSLDIVRYIDIDFLNTADYLAQELEIVGSSASEAQIAETRIMKAFLEVRADFERLCRANQSLVPREIAEPFRQAIEAFS